MTELPARHPGHPDRAVLHLHQRLPRHRERHRHRRRHQGADAAPGHHAGGGHQSDRGVLRTGRGQDHLERAGRGGLRQPGGADLRAARRHRLEPAHLVVRPPLQFHPCAGRQPGGRRGRGGGPDWTGPRRPQGQGRQAHSAPGGRVKWNEEKPKTKKIKVDRHAGGPGRAGRTAMHQPAPTWSSSAARRSRSSASTAAPG